jgi:hypothetical protein
MAGLDCRLMVHLVRKTQIRTRPVTVIRGVGIVCRVSWSAELRGLDVTTRTVALLLMLATLTLGAPRPKVDDKPVLYYSTTVGDQWVLTLGTGKDAIETPMKEVVEVDWKGGTAHVTFVTINKDKTRGTPITFEVSDQGVYWVANEGTPLNKPWCYLKLPAKRGDKWENTVAGANGNPVVTAYTVIGEEEVETPAGKFKAVKVEMEAESGKVRRTDWWAPGVGLVKHDDGSPRQLVLTSFTAAKK